MIQLFETLFDHYCAKLTWINGEIMMNEQQCDDLFIPAFLLKAPAKAATTRDSKDEAEDFLKNVEGWSEYIHLDEYDE